MAAADDMNAIRGFFTERVEGAEGAPFRFLGIEVSTLLYGLFTLLLLFLFRREIPNAFALAGERVGVMAGIGVCCLLDRWLPYRWTRFLRYLYPVTLLGYWYPDTYHFCQLFPNLDYYFAAIDQWLFGYQPAVEFAKAWSSVWWSEAFNLGYFSYYLMIAAAFFLPLVWKKELFPNTAFVLMTTFFFYYLVYLFLPVVGPQYYFPAIGERMVEAGHFPHLGDYFRYHSELHANAGPDGVFRSLIEAMQQNGERPTAAFPSSHVGMSTVIMLLLWRIRRSVVFFLLPFYVLLCGATVYIEAHYFIDVVGGFVSAVAFYYLAQWCWLCPYFAQERQRVGVER